MLMKIRDGATGILAYIIVILITIPFAFWGIQEYFGGPSDQKVAEVNGQDIAKGYFDSELQNQKRYLRSVLGDSYDTTYQDEAKLKQDVLDAIIQNTLLKEETEKAGYTISDTKLYERIQAIPQFQKEGGFDAEIYQRLLAVQRQSAVEFEQQLRQEESVKQYQGNVIYSGFLPGADKRQFTSLKKQKRDFDYIIIAAKPEEINLGDTEVDQYYQQNTNLFKSPAQVKLEYLEINQSQIAQAVTLSEEEIKASYDNDADRYRSPELRRASHILIRLDDNASDQAVEAALDKAQQALDRINNGETFADIARQVSEDEVSAEQGGDLGFLTRSDIDNPAFMDKLFAISKGQISAPIRTRLGVQIVRLDAITPSLLKPFKEVKIQVENELRAEIAEQEFFAQSEQLATVSYENAHDLQAAAEALDINIKSTDWITGPGQQGLAAFPNVIKAAFSDEVLNQGENSPLLELEDGHVAVIRVSDHQVSEVQPLETVADTIKSLLKNKKAAEALLSLGESTLTELQNGAVEIDQAAKQLNVVLESPGALLRDDNSVPQIILQQAFAMSAPTGGKPALHGFQAQHQQYAIVRLNKVESIPDASLEAAEWISLQSLYGRREMSAMLKALRETGDVTVFSENL